MVVLDVKTIFWDFDGVIKDSVGVKSDAFEELFLPYGKELARKVRKHHEVNGGMSRFNKLPLYLKWAGLEPSQTLIKEYAENFSLLVKEKVIYSPWVDGVLDYLINNHKRQQFFLITATPQQEIEEILAQLDIADYFEQVIGSPIDKCKAIEILLDQYSIVPEQAIMIGDSSSDYESAVSNRIPFMLHKTQLNKKLQDNLDCLMVENFR